MIKFTQEIPGCQLSADLKEIRLNENIISAGYKSNTFKEDWTPFLGINEHE